MEKVGLLITRLFELYQHQSGNEQLRITAQLLLSELQKLEEKEEQFESVSVFFPAASHFNIINGSEDTLVLPEEQITTEVIEEEPELKTSSSEQQQHFFDPMIEIPTLALKQQEVNETIAAQQESLNDKLKFPSRKEVAHHIAVGPIKDLRKAIGINDQYLFINELFRGDQT